MVTKALKVLALMAWALSSGCGDDTSDGGSQGGMGGSGGAPTATGGSGGATGGASGTGTGGVGGVAGMVGTGGTSGMTGGTGVSGGMGGATGGMGGATGGSGGTMDMDAAMPSGPGLLPADDITMDGQYTPMVEEGADNGDAWVFRPSELGANGEKHPVLVWGCGSTSMPSAYMFHLSRIASHGFVVYASISSSVTGALLTQGIDWLFAENERSGGDLFEKLDLEHLAVGGHSLGSLATYDIADDPRIFTTIHVDGGQFDGMGGERLMKPAVFICGDNSTGKPNCDADYMGASVPIFYTQIEGLDGLQGHIAAAREGIDVWVAWLRWQLAGEEEWRDDFLEPTGAFNMGKYISMNKNF